MSQEILINVTTSEVRIALLENHALQEIHIERHSKLDLLGNIYKGRITRLLPGIQAAFVDIGLPRSAFLHISDAVGYEALLKRSDNNKAHLDVRDLLNVGQDIFVQVYKNPLGTKGARLTMHFTIPSRFLVLTPNLFHLAISQKLTNETERQRLLNMVTVSAAGGYIFRTAAFGATKAELDADTLFLDKLWQDIQGRMQKAKVSEIVYEELPLLLRVLRDLVDKDLDRIRVDDEIAANQLRDLTKRYMPAIFDRIEYYADKRPIFDMYEIENELQKSLLRKVHLKSGGYLVFDQTEAMTTIDVNTGSYTGRNDLAETIFKVNLEAAEMIARQVRLRNLGGIIIIDFIDMEDAAQKAKLLHSFTLALAKDRVHTEVSELSSLGLVQMTRKRTRESLEHVLCRSCPTCQRRGFIKSLKTVVYDIFRELRRIAELRPWNGFLVVASLSVVNCLVNDESTMLKALEVELGKNIRWRVEPTFTEEHFTILPLSDKE